MAKKVSASDFNMSETIREMLTANPKLSSKDVTDAIAEKYPTVKLNKNSFSVAYYTGRKKLGISASGRRKNVGARKLGSGTRLTVDLAMMQATARFLSEVGGAEAAIEAIRQVQAVQVK